MPLPPVRAAADSADLIHWHVGERGGQALPLFALPCGETRSLLPYYWYTVGNLLHHPFCSSTEGILCTNLDQTEGITHQLTNLRTESPADNVPAGWRNG